MTRSFEDRWHAAILNLRLETERIQATADEVPLAVTLRSCHALEPDPTAALHRHFGAFDTYLAALSCVQALLKEHDLDAA